MLLKIEKEKMEAYRKMAILIKNFIFETIYNQESCLFNMYSQKNINLNIFRTDMLDITFCEITINYLNKVYSHLIRKDDDNIVKKFDDICRINNHSKICILNIIFSLTLSVHNKIQRENLNISSHDLYMANIKAQLLLMKNSIVNELVDKISHTCAGIDINTCDPNKPMFGMGIKPIYEEKTE